jgi:arylsulfatase A
MVHVPLFVSDKFAGKTARGLFGDVVTEIDWSVGQILETLRKLNLAENTLVIFASDNGPWLNYGDHAGSAGPLREGKGTSFEGGTRVPALMWWPGTIPANTQCHVPAMTIDILPTLAERIGAALPEHPIDGKNIWPLIVDEPQAKSPHKAYFFYLGNQLQAVRMGRWKLHFPHKYRHSDRQKAGRDGHPGKLETRQIGLSLYDLENDPGESKDVKEEHPEIVRRMKDLADKMRKDLGDGKGAAPGRRPATQLNHDKGT